MKATCSLCSLEMRQHPIVDGSHQFCCAGCQAVFNILSTKKQLSNYYEHPLFHRAVQAGLISNPVLIEQLRAKQTSSKPEETEKLHIEIQEMWCPSCAEIIKLVLLQEKGILSCIVDYVTDLAAITFAPRNISKERIFEIIRSLGYRPLPLQSPEQRPVSFSLYLRFLVAAFFTLNIMMFAYPLYATYFDYDDQGVGPLFAWLSCAASLPVLTYSAWPIWKRGWLSLTLGVPGMELLVIIGVSTAFGLSLFDLIQGGTKVYFDSMTAIITFVLLGKIIEAKAKWNAKDSLIRLSRALPRRGRKRFPDGHQEFVPVKEIHPGDILVALTGEKIVLDGVVTEGSGTCDEALMTGESLPVSKEVGASVLGGTVVQQGWLAFKVSSTVESSALHRIISLVEQTIDHKAQYFRAVDPLVRAFVPLVFLIAVVSILAAPSLHEGILRAVTVLLISCPCAIGIAAPLAEAHLLNGLAACGAIVRNRGCLTYLGRETTFVFDKTGTVTEGRFRVLSGLTVFSDHELSLLKCLAIHSHHPIACTIQQAIPHAPYAMEQVAEIAGKGIQGYADGTLHVLGSEIFVREMGFHPVTAAKHQMATTVYFGAHPIVLGDTLRPGVQDIIRNLSPHRTILLSGDSKSAVESVAQQCQFSSYQWECNPLAKREFIESLRHNGEIVCMIGDGINDAPAITAAHVGMSVVTASDISIQVSDILLTTDKLDVLLTIQTLARKGRRVMRQNIFWAFFYNIIGIGLAACGWMTPIYAASAMVLSSLIVLFNARRL